MSRMRSVLLMTAVAFAIAAIVAPVRAQVGNGLIDPNVASEAQLTGLPHMTPAIVKAVTAKRPFASIVELNTFLLGQGLTQVQTTELYGKAFIHVNLNTGTREEILLIPRAGNRMAREFAEYRPWKSWAHFDKEIGKYFPTDPNEVQRLKQYVFIPINLNTATDDVLMTIPGLGPKMLHELKEYRPWKTKEQFEKEIGKYVDAKEVARLWRYVVID